MHRRILIAEQADTLRSVAETVLRQNGYEVISVADAERAQEVLDLSRPDLMVIGADLQTVSRTPFFEKVQQDPRTSDIPLLVFEPEDKSHLDFPAEVVIPRPFDPREFLSKVAVFIGQVDNNKRAAAGNPLGGSDVDDDFLDAALGLDKLDVTDSEVMDKTSSVPTRKVKSSSEKVIHYENDDHGANEESEVARVESLMVGEDQHQIRHKPPRKPGKAPEASGKLEILNDQYGLTETPAPSQEEDEGVHDYDWFVNSMKVDADPTAHKPAAGQSKAPTPSDSQKLSFTEPSAAVDPVTPPPGQAAIPRRSRKDGGVGVEKFIDEFKREIEQLRTEDGVEDVFVSDPPASGKSKSGGMSWDEKVENLTPEKIRLFTEEFTDRMGKKVAEMLVSKIDIEKLTRMIQREILQELKSKS